MALAGAARPSVIRVRIEGLKGPALCDLLARVAVQCEHDLEAGALISVDELNVRVRKLPVG
jgi:hypothetical protein